MLDVKIIDEGVHVQLPQSVIFQHFLPHFSDGGSRIDHETMEGRQQMTAYKQNPTIFLLNVIVENYVWLL